MAGDYELRDAVDAVLEPAWPEERRRARRRLAWSCVARWCGGMGALAVVDVLVHVCIGVVAPWTFFAVIGPLAAITAMPDPVDKAHLERVPRPLGVARYLRPRH